MPRTAAKVTQADIARVLRAMKQNGVNARVVMKPDGSVEFDPVDAAEPSRFDKRTPVDL